VQECRERGNNHPVTKPRRARAVVLGWVLPVVVALLASGAYVVYYWLNAGGLLRSTLQAL
jgi:hypothetical protein